MLASAAFAIGCGGDDPPSETYYERRIEPILLASCAGQTSACHVVDESDPFGFSGGNFDVSSFENVQKRRDLLRPFGAYGVPLLLVKAVGATGELGVNYNNEFLPLEVLHNSPNIFGVGSDAYLTLLEWTQNGATENGLPPASPPEEGEGACATFVPPEFDESVYLSEATFGEFRDNVQPVLDGCGSGSCHGAPQADFYITCGDDDRQLAYNFSQAWAFVDVPVTNTQILQVPLAVTAGGYFHSGGEHFDSRSDADYVAVEAWAGQVGKLPFGEGDAGRTYFADNVQPLLLTRGCSFEACHSPEATNDFQLRSGSQGFFSAIALERNYHKLKDAFMAMEVPDVRRGRAVAKSVLDIFGGIAHRAGPVLETPGSGGSQPGTCGPNPQLGTDSAYCILQEWVNIERQTLIAAGQAEPLAAGNTIPIVYVDRAESHVADVLEFDTYQPDSDLMVATATIGATGGFDAVGVPVSLLDNCAGATPRTAVDVRAPDVSHDGQSIVFAMRTSAADPLGVWRVQIDGTNCSRITAAEADIGGIKIHNFDPAWTPDGEWIVYASTRGDPSPTLSRRKLLPQSDIWRMQPDGSGRERITFLTNSEMSPQFMREGRMIMTTEKASDGFYQLSGRRINWDLTDYHPLLAQRAESAFADLSMPDIMAPSVGYQRATEIREGFDGNFIFVFSDDGVRAGAGTLGIFNRSVGPFQADRNDPGFLKSVVIPDPAATGRPGGTNGAYRSPFPLLDGRVMVAYSAASADLASIGSIDWDIVAIDPFTGAREVLIGGPRQQVEAVLALVKPPGELYINRRQLVFGGGYDSSVSGGDSFAVAHFPDAPLIFTLLTANLRTGRPVDLYRGATHLAAYRELPAPPGSTRNVGDIFQMREYVGRAALAEDGSAKVRLPAGVGVILELQDEGGNPVVTMTEEHQLGPGENITFGIVEPLFDAVCGGCHGTVSGSELDVFVTPDALTGASVSLSRDADPVDLAP